jgi:opacity protein-like surface antigen
VPGSRWVFGIEGDGNFAELEEALTCAGGNNFIGISNNVSISAQLMTGPSFICGSKDKDFFTARVRIGYAFGPRGDFLTYVTGGWAGANVEVFEATLFPLPGTSTFPRFNDTKFHNGFTVGGGFEYGITPWLSLKAEALYVWLQGEDHCFTGVSPAAGTLNGGCTNVTVDPSIATQLAVVPAHVKQDFVLARMGLNWRFWWGKGKGPAPVVASY